jgi:hypothetical protein
MLSARSVLSIEIDGGGSALGALCAYRLGPRHDQLDVQLVTIAATATRAGSREVAGGLKALEMIARSSH